jgi:hypothetical protein
MRLDTRCAEHRAAACDRRKLSGAHRPPLQSWKVFTTAEVYAFTRELKKLHSGVTEDNQENLERDE